MIDAIVDRGGEAAAADHLPFHTAVPGSLSGLERCWRLAESMLRCRWATKTCQALTWQSWEACLCPCAGWAVGGVP
eukprot:530830-Rhodomonas_salina.1